MGVGYQWWISHGRPYELCAPGRALEHTLIARGFRVESYPDDSHLLAIPPEDHTPFSETGWPQPATRGIGYAIDVFGPPAELLAVALGIIDAKDSGDPGAAAVKYLNYTASDNRCWHVSWMPGLVIRSSTDRGHLHISFRTDVVQATSAILAFDPLEGTVSLTEEDKVNIACLVVQGSELSGVPDIAQNLMLRDVNLKTINAAIAELPDKIRPAAVTVDEADVARLLAADTAFVDRLGQAVGETLWERFVQAVTSMHGPSA